MEKQTESEAAVAKPERKGKAGNDTQDMVLYSAFSKNRIREGGETGGGGGGEIVAPRRARKSTCGFQK